MKYRGFTNPQTTSEILVNNLCYMRQQRLGVSQAELATRAGVHIKKIGSYEEGRAEPTVKTALALCQAFGCTLDELLTKPFRAGMEPTTEPTPRAPRRNPKNEALVQTHQTMAQLYRRKADEAKYEEGRQFWLNKATQHEANAIAAAS